MLHRFSDLHGLLTVEDTAVDGLESASENCKDIILAVNNIINPRF